MASRLIARRIPQALLTPRRPHSLTQPLTQLHPRSLTQPLSQIHPPFQVRTMASSPKKFEYLVVLPDKPNSFHLRVEVRDQHLANMKAKVATGDFKEGGALLNKVPEDTDALTWDFWGSSFVVAATSKEEVIEHIKDDVYYKVGVWDLDKAQIIPFFCAFRLP